MVDRMLGYISGEQKLYRLTRLADYFPWLFQMRYGADRYVVEYRESGSEKVHRIVVDGIPYDEFAELGARAVEPGQGAPYRYAVPHGADYALLDFAGCIDASRMATISIKRFRLPGADAHAPSPTVPNLIVPASQALDAAIEMLK